MRSHGIEGSGYDGLKAPGIVTFMVSVILTVTALIM